jgi:hypothetical protein
MAGVAFAVEGDGVGFATESYAASALYTTLANLSADLWRIRRARFASIPVISFRVAFYPPVGLSRPRYLPLPCVEWAWLLAVSLVRHILHSLGAALGFADFLAALRAGTPGAVSTASRASAPMNNSATP